MAKYVVTGGTPLSGRVVLSGAKNAGFKLMIAALLADSPSRISNVGLISEIDFAQENITALGGKVSFLGEHTFEVDPTHLSKPEISQENGAKSRSSTMYIPALLHRFGRAVVPLPGGDKIGSRPLERHFDGLKAMGVEVETGGGVVTFKLKDKLNRLQGASYRFKKNSHTGTETLLMAAVKADGQTILENAAQEPEVSNMIDFLNRMGGKITRAGRTITIDGVETLRGAEIAAIPDRNEAVTFGCIALGTKGDIVIEQVVPSYLTAFLGKVREAGGAIEMMGEAVRIYYLTPLKATNVEAVPYPGFMTDWQPLWTTLMTQASGESVVHETVHESRFGYVANLIKMGARIDLFRPQVDNPEGVYNFNLSDDRPEYPHAARVFGQTPLHGQEVEIKDIRAGATMMMAGLIADGQTIINDSLDQIKRGYEDLPGKLKSLGAKIEVKE